MASVLKVNTLTGVTTAGSIAVTGEGNSTTTNLQQGLCKVWYTLGVDAVLDDSFNCGSITDTAASDYTIAFTNNMGNALFSFTGGYLATGDNPRVYFHNAIATSNIETALLHSNDGAKDEGNVTSVKAQITGDLA
jgi:hypothetical protein